MKRILFISPFCPASPAIIGSNGGSPYWIIKNAENYSIDLVYAGKRQEKFEDDPESVNLN